MSESSSNLRAIGLMSGTSMDGVDVALLDTDGATHVAMGPAAFFAYSDADRTILRAALAEAPALTDRRARPGILAQAEALVTQRHAEAVEAFLAQNNLNAASIDVVGFHGQTVFHKPEAKLTVQIGDGAALSARLGIPVVFDFRAADVAAGGQGAPLVPVYHRALVEAAKLSGPVAVLNVGGVANLTLLDGARDPLACDTGPGNALLDDLMLERTGTPIDRDGACAALGQVDEEALSALMAHPFFALPAPKSLDRNAFSRDAVAALTTEDAAATLTAFTAESVASLLRLLPKTPTKIIVCGGGTHNPVLMSMLEARCGVAVLSASALGWSADAMEAQAFAFLAVRHLRGLPLTFPTTTGVNQPTTGGMLAQQTVKARLLG